MDVVVLDKVDNNNLHIVYRCSALYELRRTTVCVFFLQTPSIVFSRWYSRSTRRDNVCIRVVSTLSDREAVTNSSTPEIRLYLASSVCLEALQGPNHIDTIELLGRNQLQRDFPQGVHFTSSKRLGWFRQANLR